MIQEEAKRRMDEKTKDLLLDYYLTFQATPHGQRVLKDLAAGYSENSFVPGYPDVTAFKEGRRSVPEDIHKILIQATALGLTPLSAANEHHKDTQTEVKE